MTTERDPRTHIVLSWLREETHENAERVLLRALDEVDTTPQRRSLWPAWRTNRMKALANLVAAAAAVLVVAIVGYQFLPGGSGFGGPRPTQPTVTLPPLGLAGNGLIAVAKDGDILVADRPGGDLRPLVAGPEDDRSPMFSPDGTRLAFIRDTHPGSSLMVADADGTNVVAIPLEFTDWDGSWSFAPDGRSLMTTASIDGDWRVVVRPVDPAAALTVLNLRLLDASMLRTWAKPTFNPTNAQEILVVARGLEPDAPDGGGLYVYDLATGGIRTIVEPADEQAFLDIAWLPDGQHIIYRIGSEPHIVAADGSGDRVFDALRGRVSPLSNDGNRIVASRVGPDMERWVIVPINGDGEPVWLTCNLATPSCPLDWIWSPDDSMLIGTTYDEVSSPGEDGLTETYLLVDANTGQETELDWRGLGRPAWQRVAP
jgi:dipeptidyl aminopeptidase/acylaminoacyl peptidase